MALFKRKKSDPEHEQYVSFVEEKIEEGTDWRILRQVMINRAFYEGKQWLSWDENTKRLYEPPLRRGEIRYTYNKIKPSIITLLAKLTKNRVALEVIPDTNDDERVEIAKAGNKFLKWVWQDDDMDGKSATLKLHMLIDGFPALKTYVDKNKGEEIVPDPTEEEPNPQPIRTGKICTYVADQMNLRIDPSAKRVEEIRWVTELIPKDVDEIKQEYGVEVQPEGNIEITPTFNILGTENTKKYKNMAMVKEYWEKPNPKYPNGRKITTCNGKLLDYTENPGEFPYIFFPMIPVPGRAIADGLVKDMTTPQRSYNVKRTAEARILEEMGNPMWLLPELAGVDEDEVTNEIGGLLHWSGQGPEPKRVEGAKVDNSWQNAMERDEADMEDISGAHEISQGSVPKGVDTYGGLQLLVEQDETKLAVAAHAYEQGIKKWGELVLRLVKKHFPEEQQLKIVGENGEVEVFSFAGADLTGMEDVDVIQGSSMPESRVAKEAKIFQMWNAGMFVNPKTGRPDTRKVARMLGQNIAEAYFDDTELDENKAKMENKIWEKTFGDPQMIQMFQQWQQQVSVSIAQAQQTGQPVTIPPMPIQLPAVRPFYDHEIHLQMHNRFRKSDFYDNLPPEIQQIIDQHCAEHEQYLMQQQMPVQPQINGAIPVQG